MIVRPFNGALLLITQPDHAALSAELVAAWRADGFDLHPRRPAVLLATREHDNGWREPDATPLVDSEDGLPCDFMAAPDAVKQAVWPRGVRRLGPTDPYAAALVATHALTVHRRHARDTLWQDFVRQMTALRAEMLGRAGRAPEAQWQADYRFLYLGDILSLIFCNGWTIPVEEEGYRMALSGHTVAVRPDPFGGRQVSLCVKGRRIPRRRYASDDDLRDTLARAAWEWLEGVATGET